MLQVNEENYKILKKVEVITSTDCDSDIVWMDKKNKRGYIFPDALYSMIEELLYEYDLLQEKLEDTIDDRNENYQPIPFNPYDEYGISESDFH